MIEHCELSNLCRADAFHARWLNVMGNVIGEGEVGVVCWQLAGGETWEMAEFGGGQIVDDAPVDAKYDHLLEHVVW